MIITVSNNITKASVSFSVFTGTEKFVDNLLNLMDHEPSFLLGSVSTCIWLLVVNPLSPNSDQHQFSSNNIHMLPRAMVMRINQMITKEKML